MPYFPGAEQTYEGLPVAFVSRDLHAGSFEGIGGGRSWGEVPPSIASITPGFLKAAESRLGFLARDLNGTRWKISPAYWAAKIRKRVPKSSAEM